MNTENVAASAPVHRVVGLRPFYDEAGITIYHADCLEILPSISGVSVIVTDPPYGYSYASNHVCGSTTADWMQTEIHGDTDVSMRDRVLSWANGIPWLADAAWHWLDHKVP